VECRKKETAFGAWDRNGVAFIADDFDGPLSEHFLLRPSAPDA
jgi:hypothetical protein